MSSDGQDVTVSFWSEGNGGRYWKAVKLVILEIQSSSKLFIPFKKLKSVCKPKSNFETENSVKLFCDDRKAKGSMTKLGLLEKTSIERLNDVTLVLPRKSAGRKIVLMR